MQRLDRLARWWLRWSISILVLMLAGVAVVFGLSRAQWLPKPHVLTIMPADSSNDVPLQTPLVIDFSMPMDRTSVERALQIDPPLAGTWTWQNRRRATFTPETGLTPATTYTLQLSRAARSLLNQQLPAPSVVTFRAVSTPNVILRQPAPNSTIRSDEPLVLRFDRAMIQTTEIGMRGLPELTIQPTATLNVQWLDQQTVLVDADWQPTMRYTATIRQLRDPLGTPLDVPAWTFTIAAPTPTNANQTLSLDPNEAIPLAFDQMLTAPEIAWIEQNLDITPPISPTWELDGDMQTLLLTAQWQAGVSYSATLPLSRTATWYWQIDTPLNVIGSVPGKSGSIAATGSVRLVFDAEPNPQTLRDQLKLEPPIDQFQVNVTGKQATVQGNFSNSTAYTLTLQGAVPFVLPFKTSGDPRHVRLADGQAWSAWQPTQPINLKLTWSDVQRVDVAAYQLDRALLTTALLDPAQQFDVRRYGLAPVQTWQFGQSLGSQTLIFSRTLDGANLAGGYIVQASTPSGLFAQHVVVVSPYHTHFAADTNTAHAWIMDTRTNQPAPNLALTLLHNGSQIAAGTTAADGTATFAVSAGDTLWLIGGDATTPIVATTSVIKHAPNLPAHVQAMLDRNVYVSGDQLRVAGVIDWLTTAPQSPTLGLTLYTADTNAALQTQTLTLNGATFNATMQPPAGLAAGNYELRVSFNRQTLATIPFAIADDWVPLIQIDTPSYHQPSTPLYADVRLFTPDSTPAALAKARWRLLDANSSMIANGEMRSDLFGVAPISVPNFAGSGRLIIEFNGVQAERVIVPTQRSIRLQSSTGLTTPRSSIALTATVTDNGAPVANAPVALTIAGSATPQTLNGRTDATGRWTGRWQVPASGQYMLTASSDATRSNTVQVWAGSRGFVGWKATPFQLVAQFDQTTRMIRVLPTANSSQATAHVSWFAPNVNGRFSQSWNAGELLTWTLPVSATGEVSINASLYDAATQQFVMAQTSINIEPAASRLGMMMTPNGLQIESEPRQTAQIQLAVREINQAQTGTWLTQAMPNGRATIPLNLPPSFYGWEVQALAVGDAGIAQTGMLLPPQPTPMIDLLVADQMTLNDILTATVRVRSWNGAGTATVSVTTSTNLQAQAVPVSVVLNSDGVGSATFSIKPIMVGMATINVQIQTTNQIATIEHELTIVPAIMQPDSKTAAPLYILVQPALREFEPATQQLWTVTLVVVEPLDGATLDLPFPAGLNIESVDSGDVVIDTLGIRINRSFATGVYNVRVHTRAAYPGDFWWNAPDLRANDQPVAVRFTPTRLKIQ